MGRRPSKLGASGLMSVGGWLRGGPPWPSHDGFIGKGEELRES